jgi:predicted porin
MAQSSVTLYGRLDASVGNLTTKLNGVKDVTQSGARINSSELNTTFWGLKGSEDLGNGMRAEFKLESNFDIDTGMIGDKSSLFEREANVGLVSGFGTVKLGRQHSAYDALRVATNNVYDSNFSTTGTVWKTGIADHTKRVSNAVSYTSPTVGGVSGAVAYGLGENKTAALAATKNVSLNIMYVAGPLLVGYAYQAEDARVAATTVPAPGAAAYNTAKNKYNLFAGSYDFGVAKLVGGYNQAKSGATKDKEYQLGVNVPVTSAAAIAAGVSKSKSEVAGNDNDGTGYSLVGTYNLSKRTTLYAGYENTKVEKTNGTSTTKVSNFATGVRHTF